MTGYGRKDFLGILGLSGAGALLGSPPLAGQETPQEPSRPGFRHELDKARSVVGASHSNLDRVQELVEAQPALAKAAWDWGFGDWESALGAASHTGARPIAEYLIARGARPTLFSSAMMGEVDVVRALVSANPDLAHAHGPHGIPLLNHARAGRDRAELVVEYLVEECGVTDLPMGVEATPDLHARYGGTYSTPGDGGATLTVSAADRWLMIGAGSTASSRVLPVGDDRFHPTGAPHVRLEFEVAGAQAQRVMITDGPDRWVLERRTG